MLCGLVDQRVSTLVCDVSLIDVTNGTLNMVFQGRCLLILNANTYEQDAQHGLPGSTLLTDSFKMNKRWHDMKRRSSQVTNFEISWLMMLSSSSTPFMHAVAFSCVCVMYMHVSIRSGVSIMCILLCLSFSVEHSAHI